MSSAFSVVGGKFDSLGFRIREVYEIFSFLLVFG